MSTLNLFHEDQPGQRIAMGAQAFYCLLELAQRAAAEAGFNHFHPDTCLINRYLPGARGWACIQSWAVSGSI